MKIYQYFVKRRLSFLIFYYVTSQNTAFFMYRCKKNIKYYLLLNLIICWGLFNAYANLYLRFFDKILFGGWKKNLFFLNDFTKQRPILAFNYFLWFFFWTFSVKLGKNVMTSTKVIQSLKLGVNNCVIWLCLRTCQRFSRQVFDFLIKKILRKNKIVVLLNHFYLLINLKNNK